jgi:hypothetical protein
VWRQALYYTRQALDEHAWHISQYIQVLNSPDCVPSRMAATVTDALARLDLHALAHGNILESEAQVGTGRNGGGGDRPGRVWVY